ncbi:transposase [Subsaximicrobium wynnwilliamsii]|uniref:Transposase n=1 Tax=Subsaximicrobium wynnwilliamsii TaxID=291179 RepID=A0A5C6ZNU5_9FLAO|nr:transposase [Subsaximicrobium wynnwilliamsii]TXD91021.1 transposase [Subsaximicrobium wynnwilliamsii]TXE01100.1 transposase [Subsaximicrobium wynnwilliamsii]
MKSSLKSPLTSVVHVDDFVIGGPEEGEKGRSKGRQKLIVLAIEVLENGVGRAYAELIENSSAK